MTPRQVKLMNKNNLNRSQHYLQLILEIYKRIPKHRKTTAKEIQMQLANIGIIRTERTIQRNLADIVQFFDDIDVDNRERPYGYTRRSNSMLSHNPQEALLLHLTTHYLNYLLPVTLTTSMESVFSDAKRIFLPENVTSKERQWIDKVCVITEPLPTASHIVPHVFESISYALFHNRLLSRHYIDSSKSKKIKDVMPLGLAQKGRWLYLIYKLKGDHLERMLAVHDIMLVNVSTFQFIYPTDFKLKQYIAERQWLNNPGRNINFNKVSHAI